MKRCTLIFLLALTVRISFLILAPARPLYLDDAISWDSVAWNFLNGRGFTEIDGKPTSLRPPIYPIFLAGIYFLFNRNYFFVYLIQSILGALSCVLIFLLANKFFDENKSFLVSLGCVFWPPLIVYTGIIATETLYIFLLLLFFNLLYYLRVEFTNKYVILGILLGIINLTRSTIVFYPIFLVIFMLLTNKKDIPKILLMFGISLVCISPWTIRNYVVFKRFLLINTAAGELFWSGTYIPWDGICKHGRDENFYKLFNLENPVDNDRKMFIEGLKNIKKNPIGFLKLSVKKFFRFWFKPVGQELTYKKYKLLGILLYIPHGLLVILCWFYLIKFYKKEFFYIVVLFVYFTVMHNLLAPIPRYRLPIEPFVVMFAIACLVEIFRLSIIYDKKIF